MSFDFYKHRWSQGLRLIDMKADGSCAIHALGMVTNRRNCTADEVEMVRADIAHAIHALTKVPSWRLAYYVTEGVSATTGIVLEVTD